jgi:hypothetical protein
VTLAEMQDPQWWYRRHGRVRVLVRAADFDDEAELHGVDFGEVLEIHENAQNRRFRYNHGYIEGERSTPLMMLGYTQSHRFLCVPIAPTGTLGQWKVITAYEPDDDFYEDWVWEGRK